MGGSAFSSGDAPLATPRMPKEVHDAVRDRCHAALRELYHHVASPIPGPGKADFGDVDIVVAGPRHGDGPSTRESLERVGVALGARRAIIKENCASNFALPWPASDDGEQRHVQVDVVACASAEAMRWTLFKQAHGDMWTILGSVIRPFGLTADDGALWLRVPEMEAAQRKRARVFLTSDPAQVLGLLGLPAERYWEGPFEDAEAMYEYAARCRMMWVPPADDGADDGADGRQLTSGSARDRRKTKLRPAVRAWADGFVARCRREGRFAARPTSRDEVARDAFARFAGAEADYRARRHAFLLGRQREAIGGELMAAAVPAADAADARAVMHRACLVKALRRIVLDGDESYGVAPPGGADGLRDADGLFALDRVAAFIGRVREQVGQAAMERQRAQYAGHLGRVAFGSGDTFNPLVSGRQSGRHSAVLSTRRHEGRGCRMTHLASIGNGSCAMACAALGWPTLASS